MTYFWFNIYSLQHLLNVSIGAKTYFMRKFFQETCITCLVLWRNNLGFQNVEWSQNHSGYNVS